MPTRTSPTNQAHVENEILQYRSVLALNREIFLLNYGQELQAFDDADKKLQKLIEVIARRESDQGESHVGLIPFMLILLRQSRAAFECLSRYQPYDTWIVFRPALEAALIVGKFLDDPANANLWANRKQIWANRRQNKQKYTKYQAEFENDGLIPKILPYGKEFRRLLSKINDEFMHMNLNYLAKSHRVHEIDSENAHIETQLTGGDSQEHKSFLFSFIHLHRLLISSLGQALGKKFSGEPDLNIDIRIIEKIWIPKIIKTLQQRPELGYIYHDYGLWSI